MNFATIIGIIIAILVLLFAIGFSSSQPSSFVNIPGLIIVTGGTIAAAFVSYSLKEIASIFKSFRVVLHDKKLDASRDIEELVAVARLWFRHDVKGIEDELNNIKNSYLRSGIQLIIDKTPIKDTLSLLSWRIARLKVKERAEAQIFRSLASYAPAFGMMGTLVGLINLMHVLDERNFSLITGNMAIALVTTFYGILLANLVFKPIAIKLERRTEQRVMLMTMVMEGITLMSERRTPSFIKETLNSFVAHYENELYDPPKKESNNEDNKGD